MDRLCALLCLLLARCLACLFRSLAALLCASFICPFENHFIDKSLGQHAHVTWQVAVWWRKSIGRHMGHFEKILVRKEDSMEFAQNEEKRILRDSWGIECWKFPTTGSYHGSVAWNYNPQKMMQSYFIVISKSFEKKNFFFVVKKFSLVPPLEKSSKKNFFFKRFSKWR